MNYARQHVSRRTLATALGVVLACLLALTHVASASAASTYNWEICGPDSPANDIGGYGADFIDGCANPSTGVVSMQGTVGNGTSSGYSPMWVQAPPGESYSNFKATTVDLHADNPGSTPTTAGVVAPPWTGGTDGDWIDYSGLSDCFLGSDSMTFFNGASMTDNYCDETNFGVNVSLTSGYVPGVGYIGGLAPQGLALILGCFQACVNDEASRVSVTDPTLTVVDPDNAANLTAEGPLWTDGSPSRWYSAPTLDSAAASSLYAASDTATVCFLQPTLVNSSGNAPGALPTESGTVSGPANWDAATDSFGAQNPCAGSPSGTLANFENVPNGTYYLNVAAQNPAQYGAGQGSNSNFTWAYGNSATSGEQINLDNTTPTVAWGSTSTTWTSATSQTLNVTVGPSGLGGLTCSDNGSTVSPTPVGGNPASGAGTYGFTVATATQGSNAMTCTATNGDATPLNASSPAQTFRVQTVAPSIAIASTASSSTWYSTTLNIPTVNVSATVGASGLSTLGCSGDGIANQSWGSLSGGQISLVGLNQGAGQLSCTVTDNSGATASSTLNLKLDTTIPVVSFASSGSPTAWYASAGDIPTLNTSTTIGASGVASYTCSGDGIGSQTFSGSGGGALDTSGADEGSGTVTCAVTSNSGLTGTETYTLQVDSAIPTITWSTSESQSAWYPSTGSVPTITAAATTTGGSGVDHVDCTGDGITGRQTIAGNGGSVTLHNLPNGSDSITCDAVSGAGVSSSSITRTIQVDATVPTLQLVGVSSAWQSGAQSLTADASADSNPSGVPSITCTIDSGTPDTTNGNTQVVAVTGDGQHHVACAAVTGAGISSATVNGIVKIDSQTPTAALSVVPATSGQPAGTVDVRVTGTETNSESGIASTSCSLNGGSPNPVSGSTQTVAISSLGSNQLSCTALTNAGVASAAATGTYNVQTSSTQLALQYGTTPSGWQTSATVPIQLVGQAVGQYQSITCTIGGGAPTTINGTSGTVSVSTSGANEVDCYATASNGAETASIADTVRIDNQQPLATWNTTTNSTGETLTLTGSEATPLSGIASESCAVDGGTAQSGTGSKLTVQITGSGDHTVNCSIATAAGITGHFTQTPHVAVPVATPTTISAPNPDQWYTKQQAITVGIPTNGPSVTAVICTVNGTSTTYPVNGSASLTIPVGSPGGTVSCVDQDADGDSSAPVSYTVNIDGSAPSGYFISAGPTQAVVAVGEDASGPGIGSVVVQYQLAGQAWVSLSGVYDQATGTITVNLPASLQQVGVTYSLQAIATDNAGDKTTITKFENGQTVTVVGGASSEGGATVAGGLYVGAVAPGARARVQKIVPVTRRVKLKVGKKTVARLAKVYTTKTEMVTVRGHRIRKHVKVLKTHRVWVWTTNTAKLASSITANYGQGITVAGQLSVPDGSVAERTVTITQRVPGHASETIKTVSTNTTGGFAATLPKGSSRTITYSVDGATGTATIRQHGKVTAKLRGGKRKTLALNAVGATGKVRYRLQQDRGGHWRNVGKIHSTNAKGRGTVTVPGSIAAVSAKRLRVVLATQAGWEYLGLKAAA
jgi:hypothetical protein